MSVVKYVGGIGLCLAACAESPSSSAALPSAATLTNRAAEIEQELIDLRRDIHRNPELSGQEEQTAALLAERLGRLGLEVRTQVGGHGVLGVLRGQKPGRVVAYRAELDAMPGSEPPGRAYGSRVPGVYHVCGHDLHMAIGVGVASVLASIREQMSGTALFLFQPAEETFQGAAAMLQDGVFDNLPEPDAIYALHSFPFRVGSIARDVQFAGLDRFVVELTSPAATEEAAERAAQRLMAMGNVDVPRSRSEVMDYLEQLQTQNGPLSEALYVDIERGSEEQALQIHGVIKAYSDAAYPGLRDRVRELLDEELGADGYTLTYPGQPLPSMRSDPAVTLDAVLSFSDLVPEVVTLRAQHAFSGEDFAWFLQRTPGAMFLLGVGNEERGILGAPHFPDFDADEGAIQVGTRAMSVLLWRKLSE